MNTAYRRLTVFPEGLVWLPTLGHRWNYGRKKTANTFGRGNRYTRCVQHLTRRIRQVFAGVKLLYFRIDKVNTLRKIQVMDIHTTLNGTHFVWNDRKSTRNPSKHDGITFEQAATVFFDPLFELVDAGRNDEAREAIIGYDTQSHLLFVVHVIVENECIRIISARRATKEETKSHDF